MLIQMLIVIFLIETIVGFIIFKNDFIAPAFIFSAVFLVAAINMKLNEEYWKITIIRTTVIAVAGGVAFFILGCLVANILNWGKQIVKGTERIKVSEFKSISINQNFLLLFIVFNIFVEIFMLYFIRGIAIENGGGGSIFNLIGYYNDLAKRSSVYSLPMILNQCIAVCIYMGYIWAYILVNNYIAEKKVNKTMLLLIVLSCLCGTISGSRGDLITLVISMVVMYILMIRKKNKNKIIKIPIKAVILIVCIVGIILFSFRWAGIFLGRDASLYQFNEYLSIYIGGPLLNLNNCIRKGMGEPSVWGQETFIGLNHIIGKITGNSELMYYTSSRTYYQANFHNTGNVCTIFYDFYHDFGITGCFVLAFLAGLLVQIIYNQAKRRLFQSSGICLSVCIYAMVLFLIARSFFANALFTFIFSLQTIRLLLIWIMAKIFLERIKIII